MVPPGIYHVKAQFSGFQSQEHFPVRVDVNRVTEEDFSLKISASTTVLVVQSDAPMTDINSATQGGNFQPDPNSRASHLIARHQQSGPAVAGSVECSDFQFCQHLLVPFSMNGYGRTI